MPSRRFLTTVALLVAASTWHGQGLAQDNPSPATATALGGPAIPGLCILSREAVLANAAPAQAAAERLKQISQEAEAEIAAQRAPIDAEWQAFQASAATMTVDERERRDGEIAARLRPIQMLAQLRSREIEATRDKVTKRIADAAQPVISEVYTAHECGLLFDRTMVLGGNFANDLTAEVISGLNATLPPFTFQREALPE